MKLHDCYLLTKEEMKSLDGTALLGRLLKHKLVLVLPRHKIANVMEAITEKINTTWYYKEDTEILSPGHEVYIRLYFDGTEAKAKAKDCINAEISGKGLTG